MDPRLSAAIERDIRNATGKRFNIRKSQHTSGGCIHETLLLSDDTQAFFVKLNSESAHASFMVEHAALKELGDTKTIKVPYPLAHGKTEGKSYLIMEALKFGHARKDSWTQLGKQLARLHKTTHSAFGWHIDNTIGATPQQNKWTASWSEFFREQRLRPQFTLAQKSGFEFRGAQKLLDKVDSLLEGHTPAPSLLHGDLWSGNVGHLEDGYPTIFDPASYYGDRETDIAFSEFFGGFSPEFYRSYQDEWPLLPGYERRKTFYNLYHALNHTNLFGSSYASQTERMIEQLLRA